MLEERAFLVSRRFRGKRDTAWVFMSNCRIEKIDSCQEKRRLEVEDDDDDVVHPTKTRKQSEGCDGLDLGIRCLDLSLAPNDQNDSNDNDGGNDNGSGNEGDAGDGLDSGSLPVNSIDQSDGNDDGNDQGNAGDDSDSGSLMPSDDESDSNNEGNARDDSDSSSLIPAIGRDNSISCLLKCSRFDYGALASLNRTFHNLISSGDLYRLRRKNGIIEHWVYFSCHLVQWEAFDPIKRRWMNLPTMSSNTCFQFSDKESLAVGTELLVLGKEVLAPVIYKYSLLTNSWSSGQLMNEPRCLFGSASLGEIAIVAGGSDPNGKIVSSAELYNSETGAWETLPNMRKPRKMCSGVFMDNKFYVIGGIGGTDMKPLTCGEEYDLDTRVWTEIPNMSPVRAGGAANAASAAPTEAPPLVAVVDNELYAADCADMEVRKYDKGRKVWESVGRLPERADSMNGWGIAFRGCGDRVIVIGGPRTSGAGYIEVNSWAPRDGPPQWTMLGRKQSSNFVYNCAVMGC